MTLVGHDTSYLERLVRGIRRVLDPRPRPRVRPRKATVLSHRGDDRRAPENTIAACRLALEQGADGVEVDVCVTSDDHAVLWHDRSPDTLVAVARQGRIERLPFVPRVPSPGHALRRPVSELTLADLRAHYGYDRVGESPEGGPIEDRCDIATFEELAEWAAGEARLRELVIDVKLSSSELDRMGPLLDALSSALRRHPPLRRCSWWLLTPRVEVFEALREGLREREDLGSMVAVPDFELPGVVETARELGARHVSIGISPRRTWAATRDDVAKAVRARENGELDWILVWSGNDEKVLTELGKMAVDAVLTDEIALAREILDAENARHERLLRRRSQARIRIPDDKVR